MGSNFTEQSSTRAARCVTTLSSIAETFDKLTGIHPESTSHTTSSNRDDVLSIAAVVQSCDILKMKNDRSHTNFPRFSASPLNSLNRQRLGTWISQKTKQHTCTEHSEVNDEQDNGDNGTGSNSDE